MAWAADRVVLVGDYPPPYGGVSVHVQSLHARLLREGFDAHVLDIGKGGRAAPHVTQVEGPSDFLRLLVRYAAQGHRLHVHTSGNNPKAWRMAALAGALWAMREHRPILTVHSGLFPAFAEESLANRARVRAALACFGQVIGVSDAVTRALGALGAKPTQLRTLPAFVWEPGASEAPSAAFVAARERFEPLLAYAHHPSPVYGRGLFLAALAKLRARFPRAGAVVFGPGLEPGERFERDAREAGLEDAIVTLGEARRGQVLGVLERADVFVRPTYADGDAISVREALACGTRCVASDAAERPVGTTLFRAGDANDLTRAIALALAQAPERRVLGDAGPALVRLYREMSALERGNGLFGAVA